MSESFIRLTRIEATAEEVYQWYMRPGSFERLIPPWVKVSEIQHANRSDEQKRWSFVVQRGFWRFPWEIERQECVPDQEFTDVQISGPFNLWRHKHTFENDGAACFVEDRIEYELPGGRLRKRILDPILRSELDRVFIYRHRVLARDVAVHRSYPRRGGLRILLTGASGLIGSALRAFLSAGGHVVLPVTRRNPCPPGWVSWDPEQRRIDRSMLTGLDAVIHLAGEPIFPGPWTGKRKRRILASRVETTRWLAETLADLPTPPSAFATASAVGYYGDRGGDLLDEDSSVGHGFLAEVCAAWERATQKAEAAGIRTVHLRFGTVLSPAGGALRAMLLPARMGIVPILGSGWQFVSWIAIDDAVEAIYHAILSPALRGAVNVTAPNSATQRDFARTLAHVLGRRCCIPAPASFLKLVMGQMAREVLLASVRVQPLRLLNSGFSFQFTNVESALRHVLGYG